MNITRLLFGTITFGLAVATGCQEPTGSGQSAVDEAAQSPSQQPGQPSNSGEASSKPDQAAADESKLRVDVDDEGVDIAVGEAIDVTVGEGGVDVEAPSEGESKGNATSESSSR